MEAAAVFKPGDRVCWTKATLDPTHKHIPGTILKVIPNSQGDGAFTMYEVQFEFGTFTLYGTQVESVRETYW